MNGPSLHFMDEVTQKYIDGFFKRLEDGLAHPNPILQELIKLYADKATRCS